MTIVATPSTSSVFNMNVKPLRSRSACSRLSTRLITCDASKRTNLSKSTSKSIATGGLLAWLTFPSLAQAADLELSKQPLQDLVNAVDVAGKSAEGAAGEAGKYLPSALERAQALYESAKPLAETSKETFGPLVKGGVDAISPLANDAISKGASAAGGALSNLESQLGSKGVDTTLAKKAAQTIVEEAPKAAEASKPIFQSLFNFVSTADPTTLAEYAVIIWAITLVTPLILKAFAKNARGYEDNLRPTEALDYVIKDKNAVIVDLRIESEVNAKGLIELPPRNRNQLLFLERPVLKQGKFQKTSATESEMTAVMLSAMKNVKKKQAVILLDQAGRQSKSVAKDLSNKGYTKVFTIEGGYQAWCDAQLKTKVSNVVTPTQGRFQFPSSSTSVQGVPMPRMGGRNRGQTDIIEVESTPVRRIPGSISFKSLPPPKK